MKKVMHNVYLEPRQVKYLKEHPEFNLSGWVRESLKEYMKKNKK